MATLTGCRRARWAAGSSTQTAGRPSSSVRAVAGSRATSGPPRPKRTAAVMPSESRPGGAFVTESLTVKVRVAGSARAPTSRTWAAKF